LHPARFAVIQTVGRQIERQRVRRATVQRSAARGIDAVDHCQPRDWIGIRRRTERHRQIADARRTGGADHHGTGTGFQSKCREIIRRVAPRRAWGHQDAARQYHSVTVACRQQLIRGDHQVRLPDDAADMPTRGRTDSRQHRCRLVHQGSDRIRQPRQHLRRAAGHQPLPVPLVMQPNVTKDCEVAQTLGSMNDIALTIFAPCWL
jgi:hypothetical protein